MSSIEVNTPVASRVLLNASSGTNIAPAQTETPAMVNPRQAIDTSVANSLEMKSSLDQAVSKLNSLLEKNGRNLSFHLDDALGTPIITIRNQVTGEVVRQIPDEAMVEIAHLMDSFKGMLHNKTT